jgi:Ca-activated chloride channel family protein
VTALAFLWPWWWPAVLLLPVLYWRWLARERRAAVLAAGAFGRRGGILAGAPVHCRTRHWLGGLAALGVGLALLQPVFGEAQGEPVGPDVVVCLDVSRSMLARDVPPSRLGLAQQELQELAPALRGGRLGLVVYAGSAHLAVPLSADAAAVAAIASTMDPSVAARSGTDLGAAIDAAIAALARGKSPGGSIVVMADGEDFAGGGAQAAARAAAAGHAVDCVGFGSSTGSKIVVETPVGQEFLRDANGAHVVTSRDDALLAAVANGGGGRSVVGEPGVLLRLFEAALLPRARALSVEDPHRQQAHRYQWPLLAALLLWMLRAALPERRR